MKRPISSLVIASAVLVGSAYTPSLLGSVEAASVQQAQAVLKEKIIVTGIAKEIQYSMSKKQKLYSLNQLASFMAANVTYDVKSKTLTAIKTFGSKKHSIILKADSTSAVVNGNKVKLTVPPKLVGKSLFGDAKTFLQALGGDLLIDNSLLISTNGPIKFETAKLNVEGTSTSVKAVNLSGKKLYSVQDIAKLFGAAVKLEKNNSVKISKTGTTITMNLNQNIIVKNGKSVKVSGYPLLSKGTVYTELKDIVSALGGETIAENGEFIAKGPLLSGDSYNPNWVSGSTVLVTNETESDSRSYILDTVSKKALVDINGTEVSVSPDGKKAVFTNESGFIYLMDLTSKQVSPLNEKDDNEKFEFVWAKDGQKIYFFKGKETKDIATVSVADGAIKTVYTDSLTYKTDLKLSADEKNVIYTVGKEGKTNYTPPDSEGNTDVDNIDLKDTEPQINLLDLTAKEIKPVILSNTIDNKANSAFMLDGSVVYTSYDVEGENTPILYMVGKNQKLTALVTNKDILSTVVTSLGKLMILVAESNGSTIYQVNPTNKSLTKVVSTSLDLTSFNVSNDGKLAVTVASDTGERVLVYKNGSFETLTK
ncbi:stalk domain-containing protein [Peribacillus alkalitolerans]|uniref:stalk domain-containing protein n=1 Tax=Peribacillus alkalitolerans TaxID=1550385 RepID=UPI0013D373BB|nr:stalk domain-containing protein [Peribacillus alkalitolerans]